MRKKIMNNPLVSVIVITYNHRDYIAQALDSILMQKTDFEFEILIGDDASGDGTAEIIKQYYREYPDRIKPVFRKKNIGATKNDFSLKMRANGKYIAQLEGDDFWTDDKKLQMQIDFLEKNKEYIACTHKCNVIDESGRVSCFLDLGWVNFNGKEYTLDDFELWKIPGHTSTMVYRNIFKMQDCSMLYKADSLVGDRTMALLLAGLGKVYCMDLPMSCYRYIRKENGTNWASLTKNEIKDIYRDYRYICILERFAQNSLRIDLEVACRKQELLRKAFAILIKKPTRLNLNYILCMLRLSRHKYRDIINGILWNKASDFVIQNCYEVKKKYSKYEYESYTWSDCCRKGNRIVLFGAGACGTDYIKRANGRYKPVFVVDNDSNKWGKTIEGIVIKNPEVLKKYKNISVVITNMKYIDQIKTQLDKWGITNYSYVYLERNRWYYRLYRWLNHTG